MTTSQAYTVSIAEGNENDLAKGERLGAAMSERSMQDSTDQFNMLTSRVIVFGGSEMLRKEYIQQTGA